MSTSVRNLQPSSLWNHFADLNAVPRASKKEERVIQFALDFGNSLGLETIKDHVGNVIIRKPATPGMENRKPIVMQSHLDMVHQKNGDTIFDFDTEGIDMYIDGDWVKAHGTTLGADNGIGVATIMAILASKDIAHPALEALFTIDEETGMTGAMGLQGGMLNGEILLNLDTEEDDEIDIGCAGGIDVTAARNYETETLSASEFVGLQINVKGLKGGHSGVEIHLGRGNANKMLNRLLYGQEENGLRLTSFEGGSLRNAIPRESTALIAVSKVKKDELLTTINQRITDIKKEFASIEPNLLIEIKDIDTPSLVLSIADQKQILNAIYGAHNGVFRMSPDIADLVEASNNVAKVDIKNGQAKILCLTRSSVESSKLDVAQSLKSVFELAGFDVTFSGDYPGWTPNVNSPILKVLTDLYEKMHGTKASVVACHAGLECGILGRNYPNMDMISYGPTIKGAHSPDERVNIASVAKFWDFTLEILKNVPLKV
ncbi:MAG TPA: aminoacyl-histidine dipeptidase [Saprospiraceae bacterium]|nr:aminoacyl-histidine dipeptidase [Saprospiraceae bacterium]